jgi:Raf kinase inhibitor-like YbhB/YbcL family protein
MRFTSDPRRRAAFAASMILAASIAAASAEAQRPKLPNPNPTPGRFRVVAPDLSSQGRITLTHVYNGMGCSGQNISPALQWYNPPAGTRSYAVTAYDPDAPTGSGWWHWVMYNIPVGTTGLPAGAGNGRNAPRGSAQGQTDFGTKGYGGPCPPVGDRPHHYQFTVFALKVDRLDIPGNATAAYVGFNLNANKLGTARVNALYAR